MSSISMRLWLFVNVHKYHERHNYMQDITRIIEYLYLSRRDQREAFGGIYKGTHAPLPCETCRFTALFRQRLLLTRMDFAVDNRHAGSVLRYARGLQSNLAPGLLTSHTC